MTRFPRAGDWCYWRALASAQAGASGCVARPASPRAREYFDHHGHALQHNDITMRRAAMVTFTVMATLLGAMLVPTVVWMLTSRLLPYRALNTLALPAEELTGYIGLAVHGGLGLFVAEVSLGTVGTVAVESHGWDVPGSLEIQAHMRSVRARESLGFGAGSKGRPVLWGGAVRDPSTALRSAQETGEKSPSGALKMGLIGAGAEGRQAVRGRGSLVKVSPVGGTAQAAIGAGWAGTPSRTRARGANQAP